MDKVPLTAVTVSLAGRATELSTKVSSLSQTCGHEATAKDIFSVSEEVMLLSTTLWRLHEAMSKDPDQYTESFNEDLREITGELKLLFLEIEDCCGELEEVDGTNSPAAWIFKKSKANRLLKHLAALKSTLMVMRTVLYHGKEYGTYNSPGRLAESSPHTMHEDRVILESVMQNRNAILDLHQLDEHRKRHSQNSSTASITESPLAAGTHRRQLSVNTGVDIPDIEDVLPPATGKEAGQYSPKKLGTLSRRFSRRGVRLGVHMSLLDMGAHNAPSVLKDKWITKSRSNRRKAEILTGRSSPLRKISEVDSMISMPCTESRTQDQGLPRNHAGATEKGKQKEVLHEILNEGPVNTQDDGKQNLNVGPDNPDGGQNNEHKRSIGKSIKRMMLHLSLPRPNEASVNPTESENSKEGNVDAAENNWAKRLSIMAGRSSPLNTPDIEREFENGRY